MDRAIEGANIKPDPQLKFLQNSETLVAVNERIEEAQNYRKELKDFENQEAERVELLRQKNTEKQRKTLQKGQVSLPPKCHHCLPNCVEERNGPVGGED